MLRAVTVAPTRNIRSRFAIDVGRASASVAVVRALDRAQGRSQSARAPIGGAGDPGLVGRREGASSTLRCKVAVWNADNGCILGTSTEYSAAHRTDSVIHGAHDAAISAAL